MISLTKATSRVILAVEAGKISIDDATTLCRDLMEIHEFLLDDKVSYKVATLQIEGLMRQAGISAEE